MGELTKTVMPNATEAELVFDQLTLDERGVYSCLVTNELNATISHDAVVSIEGQPYLPRSHVISIIPKLQHTAGQTWNVL